MDNFNLLHAAHFSRAFYAYEVLQGADSSVVSTIFELFGRKELNQHFTLCKIACVHMRKCVENMKNEIFGSNYP